MTKTLSALLLLGAVVAISPCDAKGQVSTVVTPIDLSGTEFGFDCPGGGSIEIRSGQDINVLTTVFRDNGSMLINTLDFYSNVVGVGVGSPGGVSIDGIKYRMTNISNQFSVSLASGAFRYSFVSFIKATAIGKGPDIYGYTVQTMGMKADGTPTISIDAGHLYCPVACS
jgi:hypothetical protein